MSFRSGKWNLGNSRRDKKEMDKRLRVNHIKKTDDSGSWRNKSGVQSRGGYGSVRDYITQVREIVEGDSTRNIFMDTCQIFQGGGCEELCLIDRYSNALKSIPAYLNEGYFKVIREDMNYYANGIEDIMKFENVVITKGVMMEVMGFMKKLRRRVNKQPIGPKLKKGALKPVRQIFSACFDNYLNNKDYESDPLTRRIFDLIPEDFDCGNSNAPSEVDRRIVALALERGLLEGKKGLVLTLDGAINIATTNFRKNYCKNPDILESTDFVDSIDSFCGVDIAVGMVSGWVSGAGYKEILRYRNFFRNR